MIVQTQCLSFKLELYQGVHALAQDVIKVALYTAAADLGAATTTYITANEVVGTGYTAGGNVAPMVTIQADVLTNTAFVNFANILWPGATFISRGALIYNSTKNNRAIAVLDFGSDIAVNNQTFTITAPVATATTALIRST